MACLAIQRLKRLTGLFFREAVLFNSILGRMGQYGDRRILPIALIDIFMYYLT